MTSATSLSPTFKSIRNLNHIPSVPVLRIVLIPSLPSDAALAARAKPQYLDHTLYHRSSHLLLQGFCAAASGKAVGRCARRAPRTTPGPVVLEPSPCKLQNSWTSYPSCPSWASRRISGARRANLRSGNRATRIVIHLGSSVKLQTSGRNIGRSLGQATAGSI